MKKHNIIIKSIQTLSIVLLFMQLNACLSYNYGINKEDLHKSSSIPTLIEALRSSNPFVNVEASVILEEIGVEAVPFLIELLGDSSSRVRREAVRILGKIGVNAKDAVPFLIILLDDESWTVRDDTIESLEKIGAINAIPDIIKKLSDSNNFVQRSAVNALGNMALNNDIPIKTEKQIFDQLTEKLNCSKHECEYAKDAANNFLRKIKIKKTKRKENYEIKQKTVFKNVDKYAPVIKITSDYLTGTKKIVDNRIKKYLVTGTVKDDSGVTEVKINGNEAALDEEGNFSCEIYLKIGINNIYVSAIDIHNNRSVKSFTIKRLASTEVIKFASNQQLINLNGKYYALIIGINNYRYLNKLSTAVNDSNVLEILLKKGYGFDTFLINKEASRTTIMKKINELREIIYPNDKLLIYYAGHGCYNEETEKAYWLPVDAEKNDTTNWIIADTITSSIKSIPAKHVLIVSDSCYSGTLTRRKITVDIASKMSRLNYLNKMLRKKARVLISSGGNEPVVDDNGNGHSVFAAALIKALKNPNKDIFTAEELFVNHIKESVAGKTKQIPEYKLIRDSGHDGGDFVFIRKQIK